MSEKTINYKGHELKPGCWYPGLGLYVTPEGAVMESTDSITWTSVDGGQPAAADCHACALADEMIAARDSRITDLETQLAELSASYQRVLAQREELYRRVSANAEPSGKSGEFAAPAGEQVGMTEAWQVGWAVLASNSNIRIWHKEKEDAEASQKKYGGELVRLTTIAPAGPALIPDDHALLPVDPTDDMYEAAVDRAYQMTGRIPCGHHDLVSAIWVAMLAAHEAKRASCSQIAKKSTHEGGRVDEAGKSEHVGGAA